jgi:hypothetical protein
MNLNPAKVVALLLSLIFWILLAFLMIGCANIDKVQEKEGWFPVGMDEDGQSFYNSKYNTLDNGYNDPNMNIKVFNTKY